MFDLQKALALKKQMEVMKEKLDSIQVTGHSGSVDQFVEISLTANRDIKYVRLSDDLLKMSSKDKVERLLLEAFQDATEKAIKVAEAESRALAMSGGLGI